MRAYAFESILKLMKIIMIVEDDVSIREALQDLLISEGYTVYCAENGKEALHLLSQNINPHLVLLDLSMPVMDGKTFLKEVSLMYPDFGRPIVIMTAAGPSEFPMGYDNNLILRKPLDINVLIAKIEERI